MIRVTCERGAPQTFGTPDDFVAWLYERLDDGLLIARYETDEDFFLVLYKMGEAGGAKMKAAQMAGVPVTELWSHDHFPDGPGWRATLNRKQIPVPQRPMGPPGPSTFAPSPGQGPRLVR